MTPGKEMFMNCLNMLIPPLVFFSIASAIAGFGNTAQLGRIGGKIVGIYTMTTMFATVLGFALVELIKPYQFGVPAMPQAAPEASMDLSFVETFMKIIPDNFIRSFLDGDTVQIIFLAVFLGLAVTAVGAKAKPFQDLINAGNEVFLKMTNMLISFMPVMVFCMLSEMILSGSGNTAGIGLPVLAGIAVYLLAIVILITFYHLLLRFLGNLKPLTFTRKYLPYLLQIMGMGSSSAAIPLNMKICDDFGVHRKVYSLSIPLGATINMDGTTVYMSVFGLLLARGIRSADHLLHVSYDGFRHPDAVRRCAAGHGRLHHLSLGTAENTGLTGIGSDHNGAWCRSRSRTGQNDQQRDL